MEKCVRVWGEVKDDVGRGVGVWRNAGEGKCEECGGRCGTMYGVSVGKCVGV